MAANTTVINYSMQALPRHAAHISDIDIHAGYRQQQRHNVRMTFFTGHHQRSELLTAKPLSGSHSPSPTQSTRLTLPRTQPSHDTSQRTPQ
jgi:heme-binding NEAT domain protein